MAELKIILMGTTITMDKEIGLEDKTIYLEDKAGVEVSEDDKILCNHNLTSTPTDPILVAQSLNAPGVRNIVLIMSNTMLIMRNLMNVRLPMM